MRRISRVGIPDKDRPAERKGRGTGKEEHKKKRERESGKEICERERGPIANVRSFICRTSGPGLNTGPSFHRKSGKSRLRALVLHSTSDWYSRSASLRSSGGRQSIHTTSLITARNQSSRFPPPRPPPPPVLLRNLVFLFFFFFFLALDIRPCDSTKRRIAERISFSEEEDRHGDVGRSTASWLDPRTLHLEIDHG